MSSGQGSGPTSPVSSRMTKAAFFRSRSPPIERNFPNGNVNGNISPNGLSSQDGFGNLNDLAGRFELSTRLEQQQQYSSSSSAGPSNIGNQARYNTNNISPNEELGSSYSPYSANRSLSGEGNTLEAPIPQHTHKQMGYFDSSPATDGHSSTLDKLQNPPVTRRAPSPVRRRSTIASQRDTSPTSPRNLLAGIHGVMSAPDSSENTEETYESGMRGDLKEHTIMGFAQGSDEMLLTLLAGQAAMDCETLPIGGWEEVEAWKKELTLLSNRLESLQSRHQREIKILTAARTLQKLNNSNKRMSRQTMESLEQAEKRVEVAEKEVYVLQDREASLRRRLMEHWSGVMAWEVRRLERVSGETQARYDKQSMKINHLKDREAELIRQANDKLNRVNELEEMVIGMGRRERAIEEEARELDQYRLKLEEERQNWLEEKEAYQRERDSWTSLKRNWDKERSGFELDKRRWMEERTGLINDKQQLLESGQMSEKDRHLMDQIRLSLGGILGRKMGSVGEHEIIPSIEEVKGLVARREREVGNLRDEMREVNMGLEEELRRVSEDRDSWKSRVDQGEHGRRDEIAGFERKLRNQQEHISDLSLRNESLSSSLQAAQNAVSSMSSDTASTKALRSRVDELSAELESIATQFNSIWSILPPPSKRAQAELIDPRTGDSNLSLSSPSRAMNFAALQDLYQPHSEKVGDINETLARIRGVVEDSKLLVERVVKMGKERELLKGNAFKAKKLVEESARSLETYQQQVAVLEDRLAKSGSTESHFLDELNDLQRSLDNANSAKRHLEQQLQAQLETCSRLSEANDTLSAKALDLAQVAEEEKSSLANKLYNEIDDLKRKLKGTEDDADEERAKSQGQRIQLLDELNSLQAEVGDLRKQLRAKA
ncbi:uncharacterized protein IL334_002655 [Kwoniella shivajii]|uniref:Up-regulated during septation protein 1 domain-containing protein n=1 Tax=Kwoniella shivajii TaxID=564305 RepID=A0ABZ1CVC0_9TREE|nr:hypothetical protein IL334_002655 [Kwoniella shivajii]